MPEQNPDYVREQVEGIAVITLCRPTEYDEHRLTRVLNSIQDLTGLGAGCVIFDFSNINFGDFGFGNLENELTSKQFTALVGVVAKRMSEKGDSPGTGHQRVLKIRRDRESALYEIARSPSVKLIVCSLGPVAEVFRICGWCDD